MQFQICGSVLLLHTLCMFQLLNSFLLGAGYIGEKFFPAVSLKLWNNWEFVFVSAVQAVLSITICFAFHYVCPDIPVGLL